MRYPERVPGRIPQSFINDLIDRLDIVDVVQSRMTLKKAGRNYSGLCPFHEEKTPSFSVSPDKQFFHCFGCQESGTALSFVMKFDRLEFVEAVEMLAGQLGLEVPREGGGRPRPRTDQGLYDVLAQAKAFYRKCLPDSDTAVQYLKRERGLTGTVARDFELGYAPDGWQNLKDGLPGVDEKLLERAGLVNRSEKGRVYDRFRDRVVFPIHDTRGRVIGFGGRVMGKADGPKYLNSPETEVFHKGQELYGLYEARQAMPTNLKRLVVVEGYMDVVALAQYGISYAVATLGTASGTAHFQKLFRYVEEVVCCFDGDNAGRQAAWKALDNALPELNEHRQLKFMFLPDGEDPDTLVRSEGKAAFETMADNALPAVEYLFQQLSQGLDLSSLDGKARFVGLIEPYVQKIPEGVLRSLVQQRITELTGLGVKNQSAAPKPLPARRQAQPQGNRAVSERILTIVVQNPGFWSQLPQGLRDQVRAEIPEQTFTRKLLDYLNEQPDSDTEELLVVFDDPEAQQWLRRLAKTPLALRDAALQTELEEACQRYLSQLRAQKSKIASQKIQNSQDVDGLRRFLEERRPADQDDYS